MPNERGFQVQSKSFKTDTEELKIFYVAAEYPSQQAAADAWHGAEEQTGQGDRISLFRMGDPDRDQGIVVALSEDQEQVEKAASSLAVAGLPFEIDDDLLQRLVLRRARTTVEGARGRTSGPVSQRAHYGEPGAVLDSSGQMRPLKGDAKDRENHAAEVIEGAVRGVFPEALARGEELSPLALAVAPNEQLVPIVCDTEDRDEWIGVLELLIARIKPTEFAYAAPALYWEESGDQLEVADSVIIASFNRQGRDQTIRIDIVDGGTGLAGKSIDLSENLDDPVLDRIAQAMQGVETEG